jgi:hypothetical protein
MYLIVMAGIRAKKGSMSSIIAYGMIIVCVKNSRFIRNFDGELLQFLRAEALMVNSGLLLYLFSSLGKA